MMFRSAEKKFRRPEGKFSVSRENMEIEGQDMGDAIFVCVSKDAFNDVNNIPTQFKQIRENTYQLCLDDILSESAADNFKAALAHVKCADDILDECSNLLHDTSFKMT